MHSTTLLSLVHLTCFVLSPGMFSPGLLKLRYCLLLTLAGRGAGSSWYGNSRCAFSVLWNCSSEKQKALRCHGDSISGTDVRSGRQQLPGCRDAQDLVLGQGTHCWACSEAEGSSLDDRQDFPEVAKKMRKWWIQGSVDFAPEKKMSKRC